MIGQIIRLGFGKPIVQNYGGDCIFLMFLLLVLLLLMLILLLMLLLLLPLLLTSVIKVWKFLLHWPQMDYLWVKQL